MRCSRMAGQAHDRMWLLALAFFVGRVAALSQQYCSNQNTGSGNAGQSSIYQSNGLCFDQCKDEYAFAIVQGNMCWCSNYIPADQQSTSNCQNNCPGFPSDKCGGNGLFGYIALNRAPSGTLGASSPTSSSAPSSTSQPPTSSAPQTQSTSAAPSSSSPPPQPSTIIQTTTARPPPTTIVSYISPSSTDTPSTSSTSTSSSPPPSSSSPPPPSTTATPTPAPTSDSSSDTPPPSSTWTPTPVTSLEVITVSGAIVTQTVTSMPSEPPQSYLQPQREDKNLSGGAIGGIVAGVLGGIALAALVYFLIRRNKRSSNDVERPRNGHFSPVRKLIPGRQASVLSRTGLLSSEPAPPMTEKPDLFVNTSHSQLGRRGSMGASAAMGESAPHSASTATAERRNSRLMFVDSRLNPNALMMGDNGSQTSIGTIQDNRDYTRPLGVTNPDPPENRYYRS